MEGSPRSPLALALLFILLAPRSARADPAERESAPARRPNLVLLTLDTTRADRLGCYGGSAPTPVLDRLAASGLRYARAVSPSPLTLPAHCSLMTGREPAEHGVRDNGLAALPAGVPTLATTLSARGYATAAFVSSRVLDRRFGLDRGFDLYDDAMVAERTGEYGYPERSAEEVTDAAITWMEESEAAARDRPFFLWVHYYDPHAPYAPPREWRGTTEEEDYAGEIGYMDREIGRLLAALPGAAADRLVAVVGDHGEALGAHGEPRHGLFLYRPTLEVPLILSGAGVPAGKVAPGLAGTVRLAPTLLRLLGLDEAARGHGQPLPLDARGAAPPPVYSETFLPASAYGWSALKAVTEPRWRLVVAPEPELYDVVADPLEERNLVRERGEVAARLARALAARERAMERRPPAEVPPDPDLARSLRSLGYLSGASVSPDGAPAGSIDPKRGIAMFAEFEEARQAAAAGDRLGALATFEDLARRSPGNVPFLSHLAGAQRAAGRGDLAVATYRRALERNPALEFLHADLADALAALGRWEEARTEYDRALELNPRFARAWLGSAEAAMRRGQGEAEREILLQAVAAGTRSAAVHARLAQLDAAAGRFGAAREHLERAAEMLPGWVTLWMLRGDLEERQDRDGDALAMYLRAIEADPEDPAPLLRATRLLAESGRSQEAAALLRRAAARAPTSPAGLEAARLLEQLRR